MNSKLEMDRNGSGEDIAVLVGMDGFHLTREQLDQLEVALLPISIMTDIE